MIKEILISPPTMKMFLFRLKNTVSKMITRLILRADAS